MNNATCAGCPTVRECLRIASECPNLNPANDSQHARDSAELRSLCQARDDARRARDGLAAEVADLRSQLEAIRAGGVSGRLMGGDATHVKVTSSGVSFGPHCWLSHEKITGLTAEQLNGPNSVVMRNYMRWVQAMLSAAPMPATAQPAEPARCKNCDDMGDMHSFDGEWRGVCHCPAGKSQPQQSTPAVQRSAPESQDQLRVKYDILMGEMRNISEKRAAINPTGGTT